MSRKGTARKKAPARREAAARTGKAKAAPRRRARGRYLRARTVGIQFVNRVAFALLIAMVCVAVGLLAVPQVRELNQLEGELKQAEGREMEALELKDRKARELAALKNDPEYLELVARDRLDLYVPGERVVRVRR